ncbi:MAG: hypothetical protein RIQ94_3464 [Pseudomonadota bacterium]|jgi:hypothetical protein
MAEQFDMKRQQQISFTAEQAETINNALDFMKNCTGVDVSPNKFIKKSTITKAKSINEKAD